MTSTGPPPTSQPEQPVAGGPLRWRAITFLLVTFILFLLASSQQFLRPGEFAYGAAGHTILECFAVVVACLIFAIAYHGQETERPGNAAILACGFLAVALLDFGHLLSFKGMPDWVTPSSEQKALVFWMMARAVGAVTLLAAVARPWRPFRRPWMRQALLAASLTYCAIVTLLVLYRPGLWPTLFIPGQGLTTAKVMGEYGVILLLLATLAILVGDNSRPRPIDSSALMTALLLSILSELCFTIYSSVNELINLLGHAYKVAAYVLLYRAVFVVSVHEPYRRLAGEIVRRREVESRVEFLAFHDALTGLPNRLLARELFLKAAVAADRTHHRLALVFIDLDNFKAVNDSLGHAAGDLLLRSMAERLQRLLRRSDTISRQGGDEFLLMVTDLVDAATTVPLLDKLMDALSKPIRLGERDFVISMSVGVAIYPDDARDFDLLVQQADAAMYRAKEAGRARWIFFNPAMLRDSGEKLSMRAALASALERGEFELHYQPQFDLASRQVVGVEALLRWRRPGLGLLQPGRFLKVAEDCGLGPPIGKWVIGEACRQLAEWRQDGLTGLDMAINLSATQFLRGDLIETLTAALDGNGLPGERLVIELTESILSQDAESALALVRRLSGLGVRLAIDDFGSGYASLAFLKRFAVHKIKIDQGFIRALAGDGAHEAVVRAIVEMGHALGLRTIAEGVESAGISDLVEQLGCQEGQGFYFARPLPAGEVAAFVSKN